MRYLICATVLVFQFALFGCETTRAVIGPDGTVHQLVKCGEISSCYEKAREACGGNYKIVNSTSDTSGEGDSVTGTTVTTDHEILVKCAGPGK